LQADAGEVGDWRRYLQASNLKRISMKRVLLTIFCCAFLLTHAGGAIADPASDQDMANRYQRAAQSGDDEAQFYLGALYSAGVGVPQSDEQAFRWFGRAANQGHSHAMLILAGLYATGRGVEKNNIQSYKWAYIVSNASQIDEFRDGSRQLMGVLESRMSTAQLNQAKSEASQWHAVVTPRQPVQAAVPNDITRSLPLAASPAATSTVNTAAPAPAPAAPAPVPQASSKDSDVNDFLKDVPSGLRKKFGF
jgi:hypothetical protein